MTFYEILAFSLLFVCAGLLLLVLAQRNHIARIEWEIEQFQEPDYDVEDIPAFLKRQAD